MNRQRGGGINHGESERAQSEVIGVVLLVSLVVIGSVVVVVTGAPTLRDARSSSTDQQAAHAMTELAVEGNAAALSGGTRTVSMPHSDRGQYGVDPDSGWLRIRWDDPAGGDTELYNESLGSVVYRQADGGTVAYQGGGVWRSDGTGSVVVSPPQFHYRDETLTLPAVTVDGEGSVGGRAAIDVSAGESRTVFPNESASFPSGDSYRNPLARGYVYVTVHSRYYQAWASFLRAHTEGAVSVDHAARRVTLNLTSPGTFNYFDMPGENRAIELNGVPSAGTDVFEVTLVPDDSDSAEFNNLQWSLAASKGGEEFEVHLKKGVTHDDPATACTEQYVRLTVFYRPSTGSDYHGWKNETAFQTSCWDADGDGTTDETRLVANFSGTTPVTMTDLANDDLEHHDPTGSRNGSVTLEGTLYTDGGDDDAPARVPVNAYLGRMGPSFDLVVHDKSSDTVTEARSHGYIDYDPVGTIRFLHVREHQLDVRIE